MIWEDVEAEAHSWRYVDEMAAEISADLGKRSTPDYDSSWDVERQEAELDAYALAMVGAFAGVKTHH